MANVLKIIHFTGSVKLFFPKVCYKVDFKIIKKRIYYNQLRSKKLVGFPAVGPALYPHRNLPDVHTAGKLCRTECFV